MSYLEGQGDLVRRLIMGIKFCLHSSALNPKGTEL